MEKNNLMKINPKYILIVAVFFGILLLDGLPLNEETFLIFNFLLLLTFFIYGVQESVEGFLETRRWVVLRECKKVISMYRHNSKRLKETYLQKRPMMQSFTFSIAKVKQVYSNYTLNVEPYLWASYTSRVIAHGLEMIYAEEVQLLRNLYFQKAWLARQRLQTLLLSLEEEMENVTADNAVKALEVSSSK
jgi:hypothetical protein